ncbi:MAG: hypothetical protein QM704_02440 [Anaeromyxobacteraceae bacterium]
MSRSPRHRTTVRLLAAALAFGLAVPGCGPGSTPAPAQPAEPPRERADAGVGAAGGKLLTQVAGGILGDAAGNFLEGLGVFDALGLGSKSDAVVNQKLDQIINKLEVMDAKLDELRSQLGAVATALADLQTWTALQPKITQLNDAATKVETCLSQVRQVAAANDRATPAKQAENDALLHDYAQQMAGKVSGGVCSLTELFNVIHGRIIEDPDLPDLSQGVYRLISRAACAARGGKVPFENVASHFVRFAILQQNSVELIRQAYVALGEPQNAAVEIPKLQAALRDERIQFLRGADDYVLCGPPPLDTAAGELADAIVQQLEGVHRQATAYVVDPVPPYPTLTPALFTGASPAVALDGVLPGSAGSPSYYGTRQPAALLSAACRGGANGFSYARPGVGPGNVPRVVTGETCTVQLGRYLLREPAATMFAGGWTLLLGPDVLRDSSSPGPLEHLNAATLAVEGADRALVLMAHVRGRASRASTFQLAPDPVDPTRITLAVDLPSLGLTAQPLRVGPDAARPFTTAGAGATASFERVPFGPSRPDRFALATGGKFLAATAANAVTLADAPFWFDLARNGAGVELAYDDPEPVPPTGTHAGRGVLYVNVQFERAFFRKNRSGELLDRTDLATLTGGWGYYQGVNDAEVVSFNPGAVEIWPPCWGGWASFFNVPWSYCSNNGLNYNAYRTNVVNTDATRARRYRVTWSVTASASNAYGSTPSGNTRMFCLAAFDGGWQDIGRPGADPGGPASPDVVAEFTVDPGQSRMLNCQMDDGIFYPSRIRLAKFQLETCQGVAGETCTPYQPSGVAP